MTATLLANYRKYADLVNGMRLAPRHLLDFRRSRPAIPLAPGGAGGAHPAPLLAPRP